MKKVEAIVRPDRLEAVQDALDEVDIHGMTVTSVRGMGKQRGVTHRYRGAEYTVNLIEKVKIEVVVTDDVVQAVVDAVCGAAQTGEIGDGKIFVLPVETAIRVRTGETGEAALA